MTDTYSRRLRDIAKTVDPTLEEGVYAQFPGPQYETPAEVRMAGILGADLVGMSTALEAIAAKSAGLEVLGLSLVTNAAAGLTGEALHHAEVLQAGKDAGTRLSDLLGAILERL
jgi:purine-nucleoside phosphorylase